MGIFIEEVINWVENYAVLPSRSGLSDPGLKSNLNKYCLGLVLFTIRLL